MSPTRSSSGRRRSRAEQEAQERIEIERVNRELDRFAAESAARHRAEQSKDEAGA